ncbi:MAG: DUF2190 family protein [Zoogloeaceae bacterium]|jgi:hypothetical protein|nr:DUF2190 family protein [Zoogloeaceae bacterium]
MGNLISPTYDKTHAVTVTLTAPVAARRFVSYAAAPATSAGGAADARGVSETEGVAGEAISVITGFSAIVEASAAIAVGAFVKPATDGSGKAAVGASGETCGRALSAALAAGDCIEVELYRHVHSG